jgi:hypothetical protein
MLLKMFMLGIVYGKNPVQGRNQFMLKIRSCLDSVHGKNPVYA